ncbi:ATP-binding cassette domain-containing protein, partial [Deltaproteobacteria bacterium OttesenSCG-928-K17]|nr:ATP-binding cassette domain-containing protein [Deltaproteobacteria bacterium OttesenSCG-928-K17]
MTDAPISPRPANTAEVPVLVENLTVAYGAAPPILENLNFSIKQGEVFGILGGSGSGKSSVLRNLIGLVRPRGGRVSIFGQDLWAEEGRYLNQCRRSFGMMYQAGALFGSKNLLENVAMPMLEFTDMSPDAVRTAARLKLSLVGLAGYEYYMPARISGGMQKRAAIARALALDPKLIFLDEPSAGLDPITSAGLDKLIVTLARNLGISFGVVTHEL